MRIRHAPRRAKVRFGVIARSYAIKFSPVEAERRRAFFAACEAADAEMQADPVLWQKELNERRLWDTTLLDGLEED